MDWAPNKIPFFLALCSIFPGSLNPSIHPLICQFASSTNLLSSRRHRCATAPSSPINPRAGIVPGTRNPPPRPASAANSAFAPIANGPLRHFGWKMPSVRCFCNIPSGPGLRERGTATDGTGGKAATATTTWQWHSSGNSSKIGTDSHCWNDNKRTSIGANWTGAKCASSWTVSSTIWLLLSRFFVLEKLLAFFRRFLTNWPVSSCPCSVREMQNRLRHNSNPGCILRKTSRMVHWASWSGRCR